MRIVLRQIVISFTLLVTTISSHAQSNLFQGYEPLFTTPLSYVIYQTQDSLVMDGKPSEPSWTKVPWSENFSDIEGKLRTEPYYKTRFKMLWNQEKLFIYVELEEPNIWATLTEHDQVIFHDNDIEFFIDPDGDSQNYFEIEVNALKTVFDLFLSKPYRNGGSPLIPWDARQLKLGVAIDGTTNNPNDVDRKWSVEMAVPFRSISMGNHTQIPVDGSYWRMNFSRVEWDVEIKDNTYRKKINPATHNPFPEHNWVWSPQGLVDMHFPERWGYVFFSSANAGSTSVIPIPPAEQIKKYLWLVYYKQNDFKRKNSSYSKDLRMLGFAEDYFLIEGIRHNLFLESTANQFLISTENTSTGESWQINQQGHISKKANAKSIRP